MSGVVRDTAAVVIEGASVSVGSATATTGADGRFELQNLPVGSATIITSAPDFNRRSESVGLIAGLNTHDVVLTPAPTATATVSGTVSAATAAVIEGASVSIGSATVTTGVDGRYVLQNLPVGSATIITSAPRFGQRVESVSLNKGPNTHDVVLTPAPTIVSGIVSAATGAVIEGASVSIGSATATTGADGRYELRNLPVGSATIITSAPGFDRRSELVRLLAGPNTHDVVLTPTPRATVSGVVRDTAGVVIEGASVGVGSATATTGADGRFELQNLPVGSATLITSAPGFDRRSESVGLIAGPNTHDVVLTPAPTTVSGVVSAATGAVIEGASVSIGSATATTGADGRYELRNLPVGSATIMTSAPRFGQRVESVSLNKGANIHNVVLEHQPLFTYQNAVAYLPPGIAEYKAAIVFLPGLRDPSTGNPLDSRALVSGTSDGTCSIWCPLDERAEVRRRALELAGGNVALIGTTTLVDTAASYETLLQALSEFGTQSLHPELANIPIFFVGHSMGGCTAYGFSRVHGARVAGFLTMKGACHNTGLALAAGDVPGYFLIGELDAPYRRENITAVFEAGRAAGAPWAVSIDPFYHGPILDFDLMFDWIDTVLTARLPATPGGPLRPMTETAGWLGNRFTGAISTYACYNSNRSSASWLPSRETALHWQQMAGGTVVVSSCAQAAFP